MRGGQGVEEHRGAGVGAEHHEMRPRQPPPEPGADLPREQPGDRADDDEGGEEGCGLEVRRRGRPLGHVEVKGEQPQRLVEGLVPGQRAVGRTGWHAPVLRVQVGEPEHPEAEHEGDHRRPEERTTAVQPAPAVVRRLPMDAWAMLVTATDTSAGTGLPPRRIPGAVPGMSADPVVDEHLARRLVDFGSSGMGGPACDLVIAWPLLHGRSRAAFSAAPGLDATTHGNAEAAHTPHGVHTPASAGTHGGPCAPTPSGVYERSCPQAHRCTCRGPSLRRDAQPTRADRDRGEQRRPEDEHHEPPAHRDLVGAEGHEDVGGGLLQDVGMVERRPVRVDRLLDDLWPGALPRSPPTCSPRCPGPPAAPARAAARPSRPPRRGSPPPAARRRHPGAGTPRPSGGRAGAA